MNDLYEPARQAARDSSTTEYVDYIPTYTLTVEPVYRRRPARRVSSGGLDDINPDDIIYGEYAGGDRNYGSWIDLVYLGDSVLRTYSGPISLDHPVIDELKLLLRDEKQFYLVPVKEVPVGLAFRRADIVDIKVIGRTMDGTDDHPPSCVWQMHFRDGSTRTLEADYRPYFAYGNTIRPTGTTNVMIIDKVFLESGKG